MGGTSILGPRHNPEAPITHTHCIIKSQPATSWIEAMGRGAHQWLMESTDVHGAQELAGGCSQTVLSHLITPESLSRPSLVRTPGSHESHCWELCTGWPLLVEHRVWAGIQCCAILMRAQAGYASRGRLVINTTMTENNCDKAAKGAHWVIDEEWGTLLHMSPLQRENGKTLSCEDHPFYRNRNSQE